MVASSSGRNFGKRSGVGGLAKQIGERLLGGGSMSIVTTSQAAQLAAMRLARGASARNQLGAVAPAHAPVSDCHQPLSNVAIAPALSAACKTGPRPRNCASRCRPSPCRCRAPQGREPGGPTARPIVRSQRARRGDDRLDVGVQHADVLKNNGNVGGKLATIARPSLSLSEDDTARPVRDRGQHRVKFRSRSVRHPSLLGVLFGHPRSRPWSATVVTE